MLVYQRVPFYHYQHYHYPHLFHPFPVEELGSTWHTSSLWIRAEAELAIATGRKGNGGPSGAMEIFFQWEIWLIMAQLTMIFGVYK